MHNLQESVTTDGVLGAVLGHADRAPDRPAVKDLDRALTRGELRAAAGRVAAGLRQKGVEPGGSGCPADRQFGGLRGGGAGLSVGGGHVRSAGDHRSRPSPRADRGGLPARTGDHRRPGPHGAIGTSRRHGVDLSFGIERRGWANATTCARARSPTSFTRRGRPVSPRACRFPRRPSSPRPKHAPTQWDSPRMTGTCAFRPCTSTGPFRPSFLPLVRGVPLVIPDREALLFPRRFFSIVASEGITATSFSPSYLRLLRSSGRLDRLADTPLRVMALGGEAPSTADIKAVWAASPGLRVVNRYGPTETTIAVAHLELAPELLDAGLVPIGHPHPGSSFHLVDEHGRLVDRPRSGRRAVHRRTAADGRIPERPGAERGCAADGRRRRNHPLPHR